MKLTAFSDPILLIEQHRYESRKILKESCEGLTKEQRLVVENIYKHFTPLIEATLTTQQIGQLFGEVEKSAAAGGDNKTAIGKAAGAVGTAAKGGAEALKKANEILNQAGGWLKNTTPVQKFDGKFNELKSKVVDKLGGEDSKIVQQVEKLGKLAKDNPGKTAAVIGVLTVLAGLAAGPVGGMVAGQVLRGASELIQGKDLSTAIGKGAKTAAIGAVAGGVGDAVAGDEVDAVAGGGEETSLPPAEQAKVDKLTAKYPPDQYEYRGSGPNNVEIYDAEGNRVAKMDIKSTGMSGDQFVDHVEKGGTPADATATNSSEKASGASSEQPVSIRNASTVEDAKAAAAQSVENGTSIKRAGQEYAQRVLQLKVENGEITDWNSYRRAVEEIGNSLKEIDPNVSYRDRQFITSTIDSHVGKVVARDAGGNWSGSAPEKIAKFVEIMSRGKQESIYRQTRPLSEGQVYFLFNRVEQLNEGPLLDKIKDQGKKVAAAAKAKASEVGKNLTTKFTASKLNAAWKAAGYPTESNEVYKFLQDQGVSSEIINTTFDTMNIELPKDGKKKDKTQKVEKPDQTAQPTDQTSKPAAVKVSVKDVIAKLAYIRNRDKQTLLRDLQKELGTA